MPLNIRYFILRYVDRLPSPEISLDSQGSAAPSDSLNSSGKIRDITLFRPIIYGSFGKVYGINFNEMKHSSLTFYESFNKFFTRELKEGARTIAEPTLKSHMTSPCDGKVLTVGEICTIDQTIDCVKGRSYRLDEFLLGHQETDPREETSVTSLI